MLEAISENLATKASKQPKIRAKKLACSFIFFAINLLGCVFEELLFLLVDVHEIGCFKHSLEKVVY